MTESYIQHLFAERIGGKQYGKSTAIYKFAKIKAAKRAALGANPGAEIIDMGVGEPDEIKGLALLLASPAASFITGAVIPIDGGTTAK